MKFIGSIVEERGVTFAIVLVKGYATQTTSESAKTRAAFQVCFPGMPLILASQDHRGVFAYQGPDDIVRLISNISPDRIPWKEYILQNG